MILNRNAQYFFCGIGGSGMLPLALILRGKGFTVDGSDRALDQGRLAEKFDYLRAHGVTMFPQDGSGVNRQSQVLVTSTAVEATIPDVHAAKALGIPVFRRAELLAEIFNKTPVSIGIGGTSGKSTTTGMAGWILQQAGRHPTIMNGAVMKNFASGNHAYASSVVGTGNAFVSEVDESDGSIALYTPTVAVVTNISLDHKPLAELRSLFGSFVQSARIAVLNLDNEETRALVPLASEKLTYSLDNPDADIIASGIRALSDGSEFCLHDERKNTVVACRIQLPGRHNVSNALAALASAVAAGIPLDAAARFISGFSGIKRRFDVIGTANEITVIDDFAHNPDKIAATFNTLHEFPGRIIVMFQPHGYGPLKLMGRELIESFAEAMHVEDILIMPDPAYYGGTTSREVGSSDIVRAIASRGRTAIYQEHRSDCLEIMNRLAIPGDRIVVMGARDDTLSDFAKEVLDRLSRRGQDPN